MRIRNKTPVVILQAPMSYPKLLGMTRNDKEY